MYNHYLYIENLLLEYISILYPKHSIHDVLEATFLAIGNTTQAGRWQRPQGYAQETTIFPNATIE